MNAVSINPISAFGAYRSLVLELTKREILGRYRGATMGLLWSLISPFLMLMIYTLAFGYIMKSRWPGTNGSTSDFALILFVGLIVHGFFAECMTRAPLLIVGNTNYVKRVVFPLEILTWSMVFSALFHLAMNMVVLLCLKVYWHGEIHWTTLLVPLVVLPLIVLAIGVGWIFSALGVYLRDISQFVGVLAAAMLFLSSAIVPPESIPQTYRWVFELNPLTLIINQVREVVIWGRLPDWTALSIYSLFALAVFLVGFYLFQKLRRGFADVL
ncbi:ABC transporter permease [Luteibacter sp.]|uniref:ABC transporter permease n=1 Tax=Luteibacter sp. TaxID=1886636 RepID=UPI002806D00D|nr:ABC transporter permease [Luteibacter sp.]MDQ8051142.1 ABC transporter permease [Luteibacter sp.]